MVIRIIKEDDPVMFLYTLDTTHSITKDLRKDVWLIEIDSASVVEMRDKVLIDLGEYGSRFEGRVVGIESIQDTIRLAIKEI